MTFPRDQEIEFTQDSVSVPPFAIAVTLSDISLFPNHRPQRQENRLLIRSTFAEGHTKNIPHRRS